MAADEFDVATYWSARPRAQGGWSCRWSSWFPKEGAIGWLDGLSIPAGSAKKSTPPMRSSTG